MLRAARDGNLAVVQALLGHDRALARCTDGVRCRTAPAGPSSGLGVGALHLAVSLRSARSEDRPASALTDDVCALTGCWPVESQRRGRGWTAPLRDRPTVAASVGCGMGAWGSGAFEIRG